MSMRKALQSAYQYDLFVLGAGSGGVRLSRVSGGHGAKVAICEPQMSHGPPNYSAMGGTCVNVGCVPKKLMIYGSHFREEIHEASAYGWNIDSMPTLDWKQMIA